MFAEENGPGVEEIGLFDGGVRGSGFVLHDRGGYEQDLTIGAPDFCGKVGVSATITFGQGAGSGSVHAETERKRAD